MSPELLPDLVWLYPHLTTWMQRCLLVQLVQDQWDPEQLAPIMLDMLRAPTDWHNPGVEDNVQIAQIIALGFLDERYDMFNHYLNDRAALRQAVAEVRRERGLTVDDVTDEPVPFEYSANAQTRLEQACERGDTETVLAFLDTGLDVDTPLSRSTPL